MEIVHHTKSVVRALAHISARAFFRNAHSVYSTVYVYTLTHTAIKRNAPKALKLTTDGRRSSHREHGTRCAQRPWSRDNKVKTKTKS